MILVVAAAPFVLLTGLPALGYVVGAGAWIVTRVARRTLVERRAPASDDPKTASA